MRKYFVKEIEYGYTQMSQAVTIHYAVGEEEKYLTAEEMDGIINFVLFNENHHKEILDGCAGTAFLNNLEKNIINELDGIPLGNTLTEILSGIHENQNNPAVQIIRLVLEVLNRENYFESGVRIINRYADMIHIRITEQEVEYIKEVEED